MVDLGTVELGQKLAVEVIARPTNEAAKKTIRRVLAKDPVHKRENRRHADVRVTNLRHAQRGGRQWAIRLTKRHPVTAEPGARGTVVATQDVVRDLASVIRFINIEVA